MGKREKKGKKRKKKEEKIENKEYDYIYLKLTSLLTWFISSYQFPSPFYSYWWNFFPCSLENIIQKFKTLLKKLKTGNRNQMKGKGKIGERKKKRKKKKNREKMWKKDKEKKWKIKIQVWI